MIAALRPLLSLHTLWAVLVAGLVLTNCTTSNRLDRLKTETAQATATRAEQARAAEAAHRHRQAHRSRNPCSSPTESRA
jgi:pectin methylesterase-like acyl-CoA thioesterase